MTRSMTGYSSKTITIKNVSLYLQIKSENSKGLDINYNDEFNDFELNDLVKKKIESKFNRGKIRINFSIDIVNNSNQIKVLNTEINKYLKLIKSEKIRLNITYGDIIKFIEIDKNKLLHIKFDEKTLLETSKLQNDTINDLSELVSRTINQISIN